MDNVISLCLLIITIIMLKFIFKINLKKAKELNKNEKIEKLTNKFPENIKIAKEMLEMLDNKNVKIEEAKDTQTSLYIAVTNKISIADMKNNYARIQTIAHECIHSIQDRTLLIFNFIYSNIHIIYYISVLILTACGIIKNTMLQIFILTIFAFIKSSVRGLLEIDAMTRARFLAEDYIQKTKILNKEEETLILEEYDKINKIGIPFVVDNLLTTSLIAVVVYIIISMIF